MSKENTSWSSNMLTNHQQTRVLFYNANLKKSDAIQLKNRSNRTIQSNLQLSIYQNLTCDGVTTSIIFNKIHNSIILVSFSICDDTVTLVFWLIISIFKCKCILMFKIYHAPQHMYTYSTILLKIIMTVI